MGSQTPSSLHDGELSVFSSDLGFPKEFVGILNQDVAGDQLLGN